MAWKMAKGSLFAVLLRSPWWYSVILAGVVVALSMAIARGQYVIFGITAALPFLVIAGFAAYHQLQRPSAARVLEVQVIARKMRAHELAKKIAEVYTSERFKATPFKGDAADIELTRGSHTILLSCKRFKAASAGIDPLKKLVAAGEKVDARAYLCVALGDVSDNARKYAKVNNIEIIQPDALAAYFDGKVKIP